MSFPIVLPHDQIARILYRKSSLLVMTRKFEPGTYDVHNALTVRQNARHRKQGRLDLTRDPAAFPLDIAYVEKRLLLDLDLSTIRRTGHKTLEDFFDDWLSRRRRIDPALEVFLHFFTIAEDARWLHAKSYGGYTSDPAAGLRGERQSLSRDEQARVSHDAFERDDKTRRERVQADRASVLAEMVKLRESARGHRGWSRAVRAAEHYLADVGET